MGSLTDYSERKLLDHLFNAAYAPVANLYVALATADPTDAATGAAMNECANANNYARSAIAFSAAASRQIDQTGVVTFNTASGSWGTVTHWAVLDSITHGAGNVLAHGALSVPKAIVNGNTPSITSAEIYINFTAGEISNYAANGLLDRMFRNQAFTVAATYVALTTVVIADTDTGITITEPGVGSYARKLVNVNGGASPTWDLATGTAPTYVDNTDEIAFVTATASWGTIVAVGIVDAVVNGNLLMYDNTMSDQLVGSGDTVKFLASQLVNQMS